MLPASFIENRGQEHPRVAFLRRAANASAYFTSEGVTLALEDGSRRWAVETTFVGARAVEPTGLQREPTVVSYFRGSPDEWITGAGTYSRIVYRDLWPGIDLVYLADEAGLLKYEFHVSPHAGPSAIGLAYSGASLPVVNAEGALEVATPAGTLVDEAPVSYQRAGNARIAIPSRYDVRGDAVRFDLGAYDRGKPLVIDPVVVLQSGYIGGSALDEAYGIDVDADGSAYITGLTHSTESSFPVTAGPDLTYNDDDLGDAFVAKLNPAGTSLAYLGYIGGSRGDAGWDIAVDGSGAAYVTGQTESDQASFPVTGGPDLTFNEGTDAFIAKVSPSGTSLAYSGYIGGSGPDAGNGVAVDGSGAAYVGGDTESTEATFPERGGPDLTYNGGGDAFVAKVAATGAGLTYAGYVGGSDWDFGSGIAVDSSGNAYVSGMAASTQSTFPEVGGPDITHNGGGDGFVAKVVPAGNGLAYAGYLGGSAWDVAWGIAVDDSGNAYVVGDTESTEATFPVRNGPDLTHNGSSDAFAAKITAAGTGLTYAGYVGGSGNDYAGYHGVAVDGLSNAYLTGITNSASNFPVTAGPDLTHNGANDAYVARLSPSGAFGYAGFIGGSQYESGYAIAVDASRIAYVAGGTNSTEATFPVSGGPDQTFNDIGIGDAFITKVGTIHALNVSRSGSGSGTVTSSPPGINCGTDCTESYLEGTSVTLTATPASDSRFGGWTGACSGTETTCKVSMDAPKTATAIFTETVPPETKISSGPPNPSRFQSAQFAFSANEAGSTFECSLDGAAFEACASSKSYSGLGEGPHEFRVRATDPSGNTDQSPAVWGWTIDLTPPDTSLTSGPSGMTTSSQASFAFESTDSPPLFNCSLDGSILTRCGSSITYSSLSDGTHTFRVAAEDQAGNVDPTPATRTWVVDAQGPIISFQRPSGGLYVNDQSFGGQGPTVVIGHVTVEARASDLESGVASLGFEVNGAPVDPSQVTFQGGVYRFSFRPASPGQHIITAKSTNGSGIQSMASLLVYGSPTS